MFCLFVLASEFEPKTAGGNSFTASSSSYRPNTSTGGGGFLSSLRAASPSTQLNNNPSPRASSATLPNELPTMNPYYSGHSAVNVPLAQPQVQPQPPQLQNNIGEAQALSYPSIVNHPQQYGYRFVPVAPQQQAVSTFQI